MTENNPKPPSVPEPQPTPQLVKPNRYEYVPMPDSRNLLAVLETLLKHPGRILYELNGTKAAAVLASLTLVATLSLAIYGFVAGSLTGGDQLLIAPTKIVIGTALSVLICLPSLYIFLCLHGADIRLRQVAGVLIASACLTALLLISFAPITWVFSQSTDSVLLMACLHLIFWAVALSFGLRLLNKGTALFGSVTKSNLGVWTVIYVIVSLQMMTALRPIIGHSETFLPEKKQFFLAHFWQTIDKGTQQSTDLQPTHSVR